MAKLQRNTDGVLQCKQAFQRLVEGLPIVPSHKGIPPGKITAGIVSVEAGFDRGYLKKSRPAHFELISQIQAYSKSSTCSGLSDNDTRVQNKRYKNKLHELEAELARMGEQRDNLLAQNILLYERVRELEDVLKQAKVASLASPRIR